MTLARVLEVRDGAIPVATLEGEIDVANAVAIGGRLRSALTNQAHALVVDLTRTTYLDSAGLNMLFALAEELRARQQALHLVAPLSSSVGRVMTLVGMPAIVPTHATREAAVSEAAATKRDAIPPPDVSAAG